MEERKKIKPFFTREFKDDAVKLVLTSSRPLTEIARELEVSESALRSWVMQSKPKSQVDGPISLEGEIKRLRKENAELKMEKEILKRFSAFWVKEMLVVYKKSRNNYGVPKITEVLRSSGVHISRKKVANLMVDLGMRGACGRKKIKTTRRDKLASPSPDLVNSDSHWV